MEARYLALKDDERDLLQLAREYVDRHVLPWVREHRDDEWLAPPEERVPFHLVEVAAEMGLRDICLPPEHGGLGRDASAFLLAVLAEELGRGDAGVSDMIVQNWKVSRLIDAYAAPALKDEWFARIAADRRFLLAHAITEPSGASDRWLRNNAPRAALKTVARRVAGGFVLNGRKQYISNGFDAKLFVVYANTREGAGMFDGTSSFLVPRGTPGFSQGRVHEKIGSRLMNNAELVFEEAFVPEAQLLVRDEALRKGDVYFRPGKILQAAKNVGLAQAAYDDAVEFARTTERGGRLLLKHQAVAAKVADMAIHLETARAFVYHAARAIDHGASDADALALMAKVYAAEATFTLTKLVVELFGGGGVMREVGVEKHLRDATIFLHMDGTNDIHRFRIVKSLYPQSAGSYADE